MIIRLTTLALTIFTASCTLFLDEVIPPERVLATFMPENDLSRYDSIDAASNVTEQQFHDVLGEVERFYQPIVKAHGGELVFVNDWDDPTVNAYSSRQGNVWRVNMFGGLARRQEITPDGLALVACHEMGHQVGGWPYVQGWAANDGQSDYFATLSCAKELWKDQHEKNKDALALIPPYPKKLCDDAHQLDEARDLCYRTALASKSLADLLSGNQAKYETPDKRVVSRTEPYHPQGQCRLDTYLAGALCPTVFIKDKIPATERDSAPSVCLQKREGFGFRPRCWFKPEKYPLS